MNDRPTSPDEPDDAQPTSAKAGFGESTPVRAVSAVAAYVMICLIVATLASIALFAALIALGRASATSFGALIDAGVNTGFESLKRCWLAGLASVVMTNSFLLGDRKVVVRRSCILGAVSGLVVGVAMAAHMSIFKGRSFSVRLMIAMPYIIAAVVFVKCLSWRAQERSPDDAKDAPSADDADENDQPDGSEK